MMAKQRHKNRFCWILADEDASVRSANLALARATGFPFETKKVPSQSSWRWVPYRSRQLLKASNNLVDTGTGADELEPPWPDLIISNDIASAPYALAIKHRSCGETMVVGTQHPLHNLSEFDLVIAPRHEMLAGPNVETILGIAHGITDETLATEGASLVTKFAHLPRPLVTAWIGGNNTDYKLSKEKLEEICAHLAALTRKYGGGLVVAISTHDGDERTKLIAERLSETPCHIWDGSGPSPFVGSLALADHIVITLDSETEISEACATGKPIHVVPLDGGSAASRRFCRDLLEYGAIRMFDSELATWSYEPLFETQRVGKLIREMIEDRPPLAQSIQRH